MGLRRPGAIRICLSGVRWLQRGDRHRVRAAGHPLGSGRPAAGGAAVRARAGRLRHPGSPFAERAARGRDGWARARGPGVGPPPRGSARARGVRRRAGHGRPAARRRRRVRIVGTGNGWPAAHRARLARRAARAGRAGRLGGVVGDPGRCSGRLRPGYRGHLGHGWPGGDPGEPGRRTRGGAGHRPWCGGGAAVGLLARRRRVGGLLLAALLAVVLVAGRRPVVRRLVAVAAVATVVGVLPVRVVASGWPPPGWFVVACDVGQGDAVVLPVGPDQAAVVDAGPDPAATDRCLRGLGVRHVNLLLITHFHADHVGGFAGVFRGRSVAEVVTTGHPEPAAGRDAVLAGAAAEGVPVRAATAGAVYRLGGVQLFVLGPVRPLTGTRSDPNNNSLVVRAEIRGRRVLLAGDAEEDEQRGVLSAAGPSGVRADVLKLAHHGSVYQDAGFLDAVAPAVALVSVGAGNPYGHPNTAVLGRLARGGARVLRTDVDADVAVVVTPGGLAVVARGQRPGRRPP